MKQGKMESSNLNMKQQQYQVFSLCIEITQRFSFKSFQTHQLYEKNNA